MFACEGSLASEKGQYSNTCFISQNKKKEHENYSWISDVEKLLDKYNRVKEKNEKLIQEFSLLSEQIQEYEKYVSVIENTKNIISGKKLIGQIEKEDEKINELKSIMAQINASIELYNLQIPALSHDFEKEKKLIEKIQSITINDSEFILLSEQIQEYENKTQEIKDCENTINHEKELLPDICPICGGPLNKGECKNEIHMY